jgi:hypothetical protein
MMGVSLRQCLFLLSLLSLLSISSVNARHLREEITNESLLQNYVNEQHNTSSLSSDVLTSVTKFLRKSSRTLLKRNQNKENYYWETQSLGYSNFGVTIGNPMKGLVGNVEQSNPVTWPEAIPASLHMMRIPLDSVMLNDPDKVGVNSAFNWTILDQMLTQAQQFRSHAIIRFYIHWPGRPLNIPAYLLRHPYNVQTLWNGEVVPYYGDVQLRRAIEQFIYNFGRRYDGDTRIFAVQAGILGYWGEWHTLDCTYNWEPCDPEYVHKEIVSWYKRYWTRTKIQVRYTKRVDAYDAGMGYYDDSFTYESVSGPANGGEQHEHFFYNMSVIHGTSMSWKNAPSGGEVRPENDDVFHDNYRAGTPFHQDFQFCADMEHTTYMGFAKAFSGQRYVLNEDEEENARLAHTNMGYSFQLQKISALRSGQPNKVDLDVVIKQVGNAPFYYPLFLNVYCGGVKIFSKWIENNALVDKDDTVTIGVYGLPATQSCLKAVEFQLDSHYLYSDRKIKWAQGNDGRVIQRIPFPPGYTPPIESRTTPVLQRKPYVLPYPPAPTNHKVGGCYIVCANSPCYNYRTNGDDIRGIDDKGNFSLSDTGTKLSLRCNMNEPNVEKVYYLWAGLHHSERYSPYAMGGHYSNTFIPVNYLGYPGLKFVSIEIWTNDGDWIATRRLDFTVTA